MNKEEFYAAVAALLGVENTYKEKLPYKRRWTRGLGNGRYEGYGIVRWFGSNCIHIAIYGLNGTFDNPETALAALREFRSEQESTAP